MSPVWDETPDERLLASARAEPSAFGAFYRRHEDGVLSYFLGRVGDPEVAADLTAETFAAALTSAHRFRARRKNPNMNQPACERESCTRNDPTDPPIRNCTIPSAGYRKSFRDASVEKIVIRGSQAAARFTNGEAVELVNPTRADVWLVDKFGENAGRGFFK